jgi:radical SAM superfamily enzyme YgiQ (UPF0313 family)
MKTQTELVIFRLHHPYGKPQIYLPTDLLVVATRLRKAGINARVHDLNLHKLPSDEEIKKCDALGVGVMGPPYIPEGKKIIAKLNSITERPIIVGGQPVEKLAPAHFQKLFGRSVQITNDLELASALGLNLLSLPSTYTVSIAPMLAEIRKEDMQKYLASEFSFFISQGCKFNCDFCAAQKKQPEKFREFEAMREDIDILTRLAKSFGLSKLSMYLSSLDTFQNPDSLIKIMELFEAAASNSGVRLQMRGLSRVDSFVRAIEAYPELRKLLIRAGFDTVGFGLDGTSERIWRSQHKGQKHLSLADKALDLCKEIGLTPEVLMVMGFPQDTLRTLAKNYLYTVARAISHGVVSRPYLAKSFSPGNKGWSSGEYRNAVEELTSNPELFTNIDYAALGSELTHPNAFHRHISNIAYLALVFTLQPFGKNTTSPIIPKSQKEGILAEVYNRIVERINREIPFDR